MAGIASPLVRLITGLLLVGLSACSFLPREGPLSKEIEQQSSESEYVSVDVNAETVRALADFDPVGLSKRFMKSSSRTSPNQIGVGDILSISIFEAGEGGLFGGRDGTRAEFPSVAVDSNGNISLPYAGLMPAKGKTAIQIQDMIVEKLRGNAIQPQALVNITQNETNTVTISGDVSKPGLYPLSLKGRRLLDIVAEAGGAKFPARETYINLVRGDEQGLQLLKIVIESPQENISINKGDRIYLSHDPQKYTVLGAVSRPGIYNFDAPTVSVLEAVAAAGGLMDSRADSTGMFVFRYEHPQFLERIGIKEYTVIRGRVPTVYRINMQHAKSYFYAQSFLLKDRDSVYVSNAEGVELSKALKIINQATSSVGNVIGTSNKVEW
jgi:polysaccharide biosynthesis/export protein